MGQTAHHYLIFETAGGFCGIAWNNAGITRFQLPTKSAEATERILLRRVPGAEPGAPTPEVAEAVAAVKRYFEGEETDFSGFKLDLGEQDPFFKHIYAAARRVGWGHTTTYGALAKELGAGPEAARDVGQAMAKNPVALIIPCHRVLAAGGKIGGFSAPGGSAAKMRMLALEGVHLEPPRRLSNLLSFSRAGSNLRRPLTGPVAADHGPRPRPTALNYLFQILERAMGFEPTTPTLARLCSTPELHPHPFVSWIVGHQGFASLAFARNQVASSSLMPPPR